MISNPISAASAGTLLPPGHGFGLGFAVRKEPGLAQWPGSLWFSLAGLGVLFLAAVSYQARARRAPAQAVGGEHVLLGSAALVDLHAGAVGHVVAVRRHVEILQVAAHNSTVECIQCVDRL